MVLTYINSNIDKFRQAPDPKSLLLLLLLLLLPSKRVNTEPLAHIDNSDQGEPLVAPLIAIDSIINPFGEQKESVVPPA